MRKLALPILVVVAALAMASVAIGGSDDGGTKAAPAKSRTVVQVAAGDRRFDTLVALVKQAGLAKTLSGKGPFTVFAPTDGAFAKVPSETLAALQEDPAALRRVLLYHVAKGRYPASRVARVRSIPTLAGPRLKVRVRGETVRVGGARVVQANVKASNGVIHAINGVLIPPR